MKKKTIDPTSNQAPKPTPAPASDALFIFIAGIYLLSRPLLVSPAIIDIAVGASLILMAIKQYIIIKRSK
ncbi:hypothetical protein SDC9_15112 [bioreactor metagenome]|uniref:Uncharacterized protein n=1 Tax=bioreactor metagenome TaxID=1076179 RepID=A0A644TSZ2_9ZZZZ|nr:hypothetical protein [Negativicutes bacterium]